MPSPNKMKTSQFLEKVSKSEAELQREKNIKERDAFLASFMTDPEFAEAVESIGLFETTKTKKKLPRRKSRDSTFKFFGNIPTEKRKSLRLQDKEPVYTKEDLVDESAFKRRRYSNYDYEDLEEVIYRPKKSRVHTKHSGRPPIIPVSEVTEEMINKIARKVSVKKYSEIGTSCHQCRQKTQDQKTCCRNIECVGVRGQFCGVCLENRYGEDAAEALRDPDWTCPVCRGICNCSFCRAKEGKRPTGILTPLAHQAGHKSVKEFLDSLKGKGDYVDEHDDPNNLLGFTKELKYAQMGGGIKHSIDCQDDLKEKLMKCIINLENDFELLTRRKKSVLIGFSQNQPVCRTLLD
ncbi:uncharacterized protein [Leptinotarsa decemlineata]|uniref:uncharacterized protein n=1 Tax=Leptinotarsa decemlineata TaxID=7539 RepID=UPI000C255888|nr:cell division cycle-associated 7-like protein [Leptinotarsa decemlineata]